MGIEQGLSILFFDDIKQWLAAGHMAGGQGRDDVISDLNRREGSQHRDLCVGGRSHPFSGLAGAEDLQYGCAFFVRKGTVAQMQIGGIKVITVAVSDQQIGDLVAIDTLLQKVMIAKTES